MNAIFAGAAPRPARSLAARNAWLLAALLPGLAVQAWRGEPGLLPRLALALSAALLFEALALRARGQPLRPFLAEGSALIARATSRVRHPNGAGTVRAP